MAKSTKQVMDELRQGVAQWKIRVERLRNDEQFSFVEIIDRWIADVEVILARWKDHIEE